MGFPPAAPPPAIAAAFIFINSSFLHCCSFMLCRCVLGLPASAAGIERDFGASGLLVTSKRANLLAENVEMMMFININEDIVPWEDSDIIPRDKIEEHLPRRFVSRYDEHDGSASFAATAFDEETSFPSFSKNKRIDRRSRRKSSDVSSCDGEGEECNIGDSHLLLSDYDDGDEGVFG